MLALARGLSRRAKSLNYGGGNQRNLGPINTALLAAGSLRACPSAPIRRACSQPNLFSARPITSAPSFACALRKRTFPRSYPDSPGIDKALFSTSRSVMVASKIDGTAIAKSIREGLHAEILEKKKINPRFAPSLKIIQGEHTSYASH